MAEKSTQSSEKQQIKFRNLREYLRLYKQRLFLVPRHQIFEEDLDSNGLDYNLYKDISKRGIDMVTVEKEQQIEAKALMEDMGIDGKLYSKKLSNIRITDRNLDNILTQMKRM